MKTLALRDAAELLHMNPEALRQKAKAGIIPAAKPGKCWVFVEEDLLNYLRSLYACRQQAVRVTDSSEVTQCHFTDAVRRGGLRSPHQVENEYAGLLGLSTGKKRKSYTTD